MSQIGGSRDEIDAMMWNDLAKEYAEAIRIFKWSR